MGERGRIVAGGHELETEWHGPGPDRAPTLVFLHEGLGCISTWRDFPEALAHRTGCGALSYSRFGYGGSAPVTPPRPLTYLNDEGEVTLPEVLDATGVRDAILVGHSDGGSIALVHAGAARARPRVRALILEAPHIFCEDVSVTSIAASREAYLHDDLRDRLRKHHGDNVDGAFWGWNRVWLDPAFRAWSIEHALSQIQAPILVVQGEDDPYGTLRQIEAIERGAPGPVSRAILPACGHTPHRDARDETLSLMARFIESHLCATRPTLALPGHEG